MEKQRIPGLEVAIRTPLGGGEEAFGLADVEAKLPATPATRFRLASVSKPITAVAALQLAERGKIDLDAPVQKYVPEYPQQPWPVTTRQLLGHLAGVTHYSPQIKNTDQPYADVVSALDTFKHIPLLQEPGTKYSYTTFGYNLISAVVQRASGKPFFAYITESVARPAGMTSLAIYKGPEAGVARGYKKSGEAWTIAEEPHTTYKIGGGGMCDTAQDLTRFAFALMDGRLLMDAKWREMTTSQKTSTGAATNYALGFQIGERRGLRVVSHGGSQAGVRTVLIVIPQARSAVAVLSNLDGSNVAPLAQALIDTALSVAPG